jgi:predicted transcriptional regulator
LYDSETRELLDDVFRLYGPLPAWELRNKTHREPPWTDTPYLAAITHQKLRDYFGPLISDLNELGHDQSEPLQGQALASKMMNDHMLRKLVERGYADLAAGRYSTLEEVRQTLGDA